MILIFNNLAKRVSAIILLVLLTVGLIQVNAQPSISVTGTVTDAEGLTLPGVNVVVRGSNLGQVTDASGRYSISVPNTNAVLSFSFVGFLTQEVTVGNRTNIDIFLIEDTQQIEEVVVIGYGTLSKREVSASIVQVNRENFHQGAVSNPLEMLQGKVAGFIINQTSPANPNSSGTELQIRGAASLTASNTPLVVVDGILDADYTSISPQDIESITVLKDAASAAIYGVRGANGVVLITTKRGKSGEGQARFTYDGWIGMNAFKESLRFLTPEEYVAKNRGIDMGARTNWREMIMRDSPSYDQNHYLSVDGGTRNGGYALSINYRKATGADFVSEREEWGGKLSVNQRALNGILEFSGSVNFRKTNQTNGSASWGATLTFDPTVPVYNDDGSLYQPIHQQNASQPYQDLVTRNRKETSYRAMTYAEAKLHVLRQASQSLNLSLNFSLNYNARDNYEYDSSQSADSYWGGYKGNAYRQSRVNWQNRAELVANYQLRLNDQDFRVVAGYTFDEENNESMDIRNRGFDFDAFLWNDIGSGALRLSNSSMGSSKGQSTLIGVFGRVNYSWKNLLMATASYRRDGSTKFGVDNKWGNFYSGSLALEMKNLDFMNQVDIVNSLKPRVSYGVTGRSEFDSHQSLQTYTTPRPGSRRERNYFMDGVWVTGFQPARNANPQLGWEKAIVSNIGVDAALFSNRLRASFEWFERQSKDLLYRYTAPQPPFLFDNILVNVGTITNKGIEFTVEGDIFKKKDLKWTSGVVAGTSTTHLTKLSSQAFQMSYIDLLSMGGTGSTDYLFRIEEGGSIGNFHVLEYSGKVDEDGVMYVWNKDNEEIAIRSATSADKRLSSKSAVPKMDISWSNTFAYKNFDLSIFMRGAFGHYIYNSVKSGNGNLGSGSHNVLLSAYDEKIRDSGGIVCSYFLEKGDYLKLDNVTLGYNFKPRLNQYLDNIRMYVSAKNIATFTGYTGNDPSLVRSTGLQPGNDVTGVYPQAVTYTFGLTIRFK